MFNSFIDNVRFFAQAGDPCQGGSFFGFPAWYKYLRSSDPTICTPALDGINDIWLIVMAIIEILLRVAILAAIIYVLIGGFKFITSRDSPDKTANARHTVFDALIGLVIAVAATALVSFVAGRFQE